MTIFVLSVCLEGQYFEGDSGFCVGLSLSGTPFSPTRIDTSSRGRLVPALVPHDGCRGCLVPALVPDDGSNRFITDQSRCGVPSERLQGGISFPGGNLDWYRADH